MLKVTHIKKSFSAQKVLLDVNLLAMAQELTIVEGQNGAGKSTLFNILSGELSADGGTIELGGVDIVQQSALERSQFFGVLIQDPKRSTVSTLTIKENCALALLKHQRATLRTAVNQGALAKIIEHLETLGIDLVHRLDERLENLSGGQRQILAFAMATINRPKVLLLDEPTAALDEKSSHLLLGLVKKLIKDWQIPALMISHDKALNQAYGDKIVFLKDGVIQ